LNVQFAVALEVKYLTDEVEISTPTVPVAAVAETVIVSNAEVKTGRVRVGAVSVAYVEEAVEDFK
jgi:hypothetical protein